MSEQQACTQKQCVIHEDDLPLSCPMPNDILWNAHPRVYLPIEDTLREVCPYCGTVYLLEQPISE